MVKGLITREYFVTPFGKDLLDSVETLDKKVKSAKQEYEIKVRQLVRKYNIPKDQIPAIMGVLLESSSLLSVGYACGATIYTPGSKN